jgi:membrane protein implicated in regulation of membrane protease activity
MTMTLGFALLAIAAAIVLIAMLTGRQPLLLLGVAIYVTVTVWLAYANPPLLFPALAGAVALEIIGLRQVLRPVIDDEPVTPRHNSTRTVTIKMRIAGG